jgi:hypothetical protein
MSNPVQSGQQFRDDTRALYGALDATGQGIVDDLTCRQQYTWQRVVDAAAGTDYTAYGPTTRAKLLVDTVRFTPNIAVTANGTNYKTVTVAYNDGAGGSDVTLATVDTSTTSWVAGTTVSIPLTGTTGNLVVPKGRALKISVAHSGTGVVIADGTVEVSGYCI